MGENKWFTGMLGIDVGAPPLLERETRIEFIKRYAEDLGSDLTFTKTTSREACLKDADFGL